MKSFEKNIDNRKVLVSRLSELTGLDARYTRVPRCAYEIGAFTVEKDGSLTAADGADESVIVILKAEGLVGAEHDIPSPVAKPAETSTQEEAPVDAELTDLVSDAEYEQEVEEESAVSLGVRDAEETGDFPLDASISFPIATHTVSSLLNLICTVHTRGPILSRATGGRFHVDKALVDELLDRHTFKKPSELVAFLQNWDGATPEGIEFDEEKVTFTGFTAVEDDAHLRTYMKLAAAMNKTAQTQKRVRAKETDDSNEKYSLRVWLIRLGMNGPEYKAERKILMERLSGHAAFRTKADEEKWKVRQQARKEALRAAETDTEAGAGE